MSTRVIDSTQAPPADAPPLDPARQIGWQRLRSPVAGAAVTAAGLGSIGIALGTIVSGQLAEGTTWPLVLVLALCVLGGTTVDMCGRILWAGVVDRAEGRLREDLLTAALHQPLDVLSAQAVGEVLDRVDDDTHEVGTLVREMLWNVMTMCFALVPLYIIAGVTWWPSWLLFPLCGVVVTLAIRGMLPVIVKLKVHEEMAWTDHAAGLQEGIAGRDDLRTSLGQSHAIARLARLSAVVYERFGKVLDLERRMVRRSGLILHALLAAIAIAGIALVSTDSMTVAKLVTLFLATTMFVGQIDQLAHRLPDIQAGLGAITRLRQLLETVPEVVGGERVPGGPVAVEFRDLNFAYEGVERDSFALHHVSLTVPAGQTCALVGRTGSGKSTLASLISRAVEPPAGSVFVGGVDTTTIDLQELRAAVGVVTQRTEILAGSLADNITLFTDISRESVEAAVTELGLAEWVSGLPQGIDTPLGPGGNTLSAGEEQLVAFARLLVRDVQVVVLDEATARMDPVTEARVVRAAERLVAGRTCVLIAHRLSTIARAHQVGVLAHGGLIQSGPRAELATSEGPFRDLLSAADEQTESAAPTRVDPVAGVGAARRTGPPPVRPAPGDGPGLVRGIWRALWVHPRWGMFSVLSFGLATVTGSLGAVTGFVWGNTVEDLASGRVSPWWVLALFISLMAAPIVLSDAIARYPKWWISVALRARMATLVGQTGQHRLPRTPPGEVVGRALDSDRYTRYGDRWIDLFIGIMIICVTSILGGTVIAGAVLLTVMVGSAIASVIGRPVAGRSAEAASASRARFGRYLVSALESVRTVKLAAATPAVHAHLRRVDAGRVAAAVREHRVIAVLSSVPLILVQAGLVAAWIVMLVGGWGLGTTLMVVAAVTGFGWFGQVAGMVITEAPGTKAWQQETCRFSAGAELMALPAGVNLITGEAPAPPSVSRQPLTELTLHSFSAIHDDGTIGVSGVDLSVRAGELVLVVGQVGAGKSSMLSALAGLVTYEGSVLWNGEPVADPEEFLRPAQVAHVAQVPRVLSGTIAENLTLGHDRPLTDAIADARLTDDIADAGGVNAAIGHRGVRLSGGQVQRLALARALATQSELLLADDVSSALDAATELELWQALRARGTTVLGSTSKRTALASADKVVVLQDGRVADIGPWSALAPTWSHLAG